MLAEIIIGGVRSAQNWIFLAEEKGRTWECGAGSSDSLLLTSTESTTNLSHKSHCISKEVTLRAIRDITQLHRHHYNTVPTWTEIEADLEEDGSKNKLREWSSKPRPGDEKRTSDIPDFHCHIPFSYFSKVEGNRGYHIFAPLSGWILQEQPQKIPRDCQHSRPKWIIKKSTALVQK